MITIELMTSSEIWEQFVLKTSPSALFQSWAWCDVQEKMHQKIWRFGLYENKKLVGLFAAQKIPARRGTFLHVRHGPIFIEQKTEYWQKFLDFAKSFAKKESAWFIRISPLIEDTLENRTLLNNFHFVPSAIHAMDAELSWVLDIDRPKEEILAGMRKTTRYEIKQAEKLGVHVVQTINPNDLSSFFKLYEETSERQGFVPHSGIAEEFEMFAKEGKAVLFLGSYEEKILAGAIVLFWGKQAFYHHGASQSSKIPVSYLVQWRAIAEAQKRGMKVYNFWGIAPEDKLNHPWRGLTLFKKGFGGREIKYIHSQDLPLSPLYVMPRVVETIRRMRKGY